MGPILEDRSLTPEELDLVRWLLENGKPGIDVSLFMKQLFRARVASRCSCGCASIDFAIAECPIPTGATLEILSDYQWEGDAGLKFGIFVFAKAGVLAGLEVWSIDGSAAASYLPKIESLQPIIWNKGVEQSKDQDPQT